MSLSNRSWNRTKIIFCLTFFCISWIIHFHCFSLSTKLRNKIWLFAQINWVWKCKIWSKLFRHFRNLIFISSAFLFVWFFKYASSFIFFCFLEYCRKNLLVYLLTVTWRDILGSKKNPWSFRNDLNSFVHLRWDIGRFSWRIRMISHILKHGLKNSFFDIMFIIRPLCSDCFLWIFIDVLHFFLFFMIFFFLFILIISFFLWSTFLHNRFQFIKFSFILSCLS